MYTNSNNISLVITNGTTVRNKITKKVYEVIMVPSGQTVTEFIDSSGTFIVGKHIDSKTVLSNPQLFELVTDINTLTSNDMCRNLLDMYNDYTPAEFLDVIDLLLEHLNFNQLKEFYKQQKQHELI